MGLPFGAITCPQRCVSILVLKKTGLGTPVLSGLCAKFCTVIDNGVGDYSIVANIQDPGAQVLTAAVTLHTSGIAQAVQAGTDALKVQIKTFAVDGTTPAEKDFDIFIAVCGARDLIG